MKITGLETRTVKVNHRGDWVFVFLRTDEGVTGLGEASHSGNDALMVQRLKQAEEFLIGREPFDIERTVSALVQQGVFRSRFSAGGAGAVEMALWDIAGKAVGLPVFRMLGGAVHRQVRLYANINRGLVERTPEEFARMAERAVAAGFDAVKCDPFDGLHLARLGREAGERALDPAMSRLKAIRRAVGEKVDLLVDAHARFSPALAREVARRLEEFGLFWLEDPVELEQMEALLELRRATQIPLAGAEGLINRFEYRRVLERGCLDVILPDVKYCAGILELKRIASLAETFGVLVAPHGPSGPVSLAASVQAMLGTPNFLIQEYAFGEIDWRADLAHGTEILENGRVPIPERPGLGVELDEKLLERYQA